MFRVFSFLAQGACQFAIRLFENIQFEKKNVQI